jgi:hypothetical protein
MTPIKREQQQQQRQQQRLCGVKGYALQRATIFDIFGIVKRGREAVRLVDWHQPCPAVSPGKVG